MGGETTNTIEYITIASTGNVVDFGDLTQARRLGQAGSNRNRAILFGGNSPGGTAYDIIDYVQIASLGNAADFGNLTTVKAEIAVTTSATRACISGGEGPTPSYTNYNVIESVEIPTLGNAIDFGDLLGNRAFSPAGASNAHGGLG